MPSSIRTCIVAIVAFGLLSQAHAAWAQETPGFAKNGFYVGASDVPNFTLDGITFDGSSYYQQIGGDEILILPRLEPKSTIRGIGGYRLGWGAFEVSYEQTTHVGTFLDLSGEATFHSLNFDERLFALTRGRVQPYGLLGLSLPWLTVKNGSFLASDVPGDVADASFRGYGLNTEAGVTVYPMSRVGISTGYRYRAMWFSSASGISHTTYELRPRFHETAGNVSISVFFTF